MTTTRKGWAPLKAFSSVYVGPDGQDWPITSYEDIDRLLAAWDGVLAAASPEETRPTTPQPVDPETKRRMAEAIAFARTYTGTFGLILDIKANPRMGTKYMRLSERQVEVILASRDRDIARAEANQIDREVYADDQYLAHTSRPEAPRLASQPPSQSPLGGPATEGFYRRDDVIYKIQRAVHGSGHLYAKRLDVVDGKGEWSYAPGVIRQLTERLTLAEAEAFGKLYGICAICGRQLTDESSIARGIGPVCANKV